MHREAATVGSSSGACRGRMLEGDALGAEGLPVLTTRSAAQGVSLGKAGAGTVALLMSCYSRRGAQRGLWAGRSASTEL